MRIATAAVGTSCPPLLRGKESTSSSRPAGICITKYHITGSWGEILLSRKEKKEKKNGKKCHAQNKNKKEEGGGGAVMNPF